MKADALIVKFLSSGTSESSKRLIAYRCAMVLLVIACSLTAVICYQGMQLHAVDNGLLVALSSIVLIIAGLAQQIYRKPEDAHDAPEPSPATGGQP